MAVGKNYTELKSSRFERKFVFQNGNVPYVERLVKNNPGHFSEIYFKRQVNNIYFDSSNLRNYYDNQLGKNNRSKFRIRWYGDIFQKIETPILEIKIKNGLVGRKLSFKLEPFELTKDFSKMLLMEHIQKSNLPEWVLNDISQYSPTLLNTYKRQYFQSFDKKFRFTIDYDLNFYSFNQIKSYFSSKSLENNPLILELKYDFEHDSDVSLITKEIPVRLNKFSKYVSGIEMFYNHLAI